MVTSFIVPSNQRMQREPTVAGNFPNSLNMPPGDSNLHDPRSDARVSWFRTGPNGFRCGTKSLPTQIQHMPDTVTADSFDWQWRGSATARPQPRPPDGGGCKLRAQAGILATSPRGVITLSETDLAITGGRGPYLG